ncbi:MAG: adaptor protein MecA [Ruminococcus sp.]|nr:adaptor protein MecA [Candidatus Copronaster equi]
MDIQPINSNKFLVGLSCDDMKQLDITYDDMDYSNVETRRVIWTILDNVRQNTGRDVDPSGNLMIEVAPDCDGGCLLMFTVPDSKSKETGTVVSKTNPTQIFEFNNSDDFLDAFNAAKNIKNSNERIFTDGKKIRLEISSDISAIYGRILKEYGSFVGKDSITVAKTHEYWKELTP